MSAGRKSFIGELIDNVKNEINRNKEMKVSVLWHFVFYIRPAAVCQKHTKLNTMLEQRPVVSSFPW
jgi:hypothetical protein